MFLTEHNALQTRAVKCYIIKSKICGYITTIRSDLSRAYYYTHINIMHCNEVATSITNAY